MKVEYKQVACGFDVDGEPVFQLVLVQEDVASVVEAAYREGYADGANCFCEGAKVDKYIYRDWHDSDTRASLSRRESP